MKVSLTNMWCLQIEGCFFSQLVMLKTDSEQIIQSSSEFTYESKRNINIKLQANLLVYYSAKWKVQLTELEPGTRMTKNDMNKLICL